MMRAETCLIYDLRWPGPGGGYDDGLAKRPDSAEYRRMLATACRLAGEFIPEGGRVLVVSKGDEDLLAISGRHAAHFPQVGGGTYAGHHPGDGAEAIRHLEGLRGQGWEYPLFPETSLWWLSHYENFNAHLNINYELICLKHKICLIFVAASLAGRGPRSRMRCRRSNSAIIGRTASRSVRSKTAGVRSRTPRGRWRDMPASSSANSSPVRGDSFPSGRRSRRRVVIPTHQQAHYTLLGLESLVLERARSPSK